MNTYLKLLIIIGLIVLIILIAYYAYLKNSYIDEICIAGSAYGFQIGDTKEVVYNKAIKMFAGRQVFILDPLDNRGYGPHRLFLFDSHEYQLIYNFAIWKFYFDEGFYDFIEFIFDDKNELERIYRHKKNFDLP